MPTHVNPFERRAEMLNAKAQERAEHIVERLKDTPPPQAEKPSTDDERSMWSFSKHGPDADARWWQVHDEALSTFYPQALQALNDPVQAERAARSRAEETAFQEVYPHRLEAVGVGRRNLDGQMAEAKRITRLLGRQAPETEAPY